jgi:hypothetical protein
MIKSYMLLALLLIVSWCVFCATHEGGHIVVGWLGGGTLVAAELRPWHLPHSHFRPDPRPLATAWGGPVLGVIAPLAVAVLLRSRWLWFVAYFCLVANGTYLAVAWLTGERLLDTQRLLAAGAWPASIVAYCVLTMVPGYIGFRRACVELLRVRQANPPEVAS